MNNKQLSFGLLSGLIVMIIGLVLALDNIIPWTLSLTGAAIFVLNIAVWVLHRQTME
ncbi:hypothetical protein SAMN02745127_00006 [Oceanospirillum multiglobuliferum]|uniref:hypothetical protein n=1 Tax=Oceanospirillum multiglobuliferum TaxID=64969 RepID=UPI0009D18AA6|nr:hypothetical protein [Oceanospirillum multiglobuliferum]SJZ39621.1 hypothetical protein SAMN02745127_00006 [Oceanospirillum multiglobuliferum]